MAGVLKFEISFDNAWGGVSVRQGGVRIDSFPRTVSSVPAELRGALGFLHLWDSEVCSTG